MNTNEHEYYFRSDKLFCRHFLAFIREYSYSFVAKILPGPGAGQKPQNPLAPESFNATRRIMSITVEKSGPVTTVILGRPEVRNAVDRATAMALADAFRGFEADDAALVGVLYGDH